MIVVSDGNPVSRIIPYYILKQIKNIEEADWLIETVEVNDYEIN
tara:strand:- start:6061 stop:6192 length:132 start_codon:yes stop_codon:yes gene_type:complete